MGLLLAWPRFLGPSTSTVRGISAEESAPRDSSSAHGASHVALDTALSSHSEGAETLSVQTKRTEELAEVYGVAENDDANCLQSKKCWWTLTVEQPANTEWGLQTPSRPVLHAGQIIRAVVESSASDEHLMTPSEVTKHLPRLVSFTIVDPDADAEAGALKAQLATEGQTSAEAIGDRHRGTTLMVPAEIMHTISQWRQAVLTGDPGGEADCFSQNVERFYLATRVDREFVRQELEKQVSKANGQALDVQIDELKANRIETDYAEINFLQTEKASLDGNPTLSTMHTYMHLIREQGVWKISFLRQFKPS